MNFFQKLFSQPRSETVESDQVNVVEDAEAIGIESNKTDVVEDKPVKTEAAKPGLAKTVTTVEEESSVPNDPIVEPANNPGKDLQHLAPGVHIGMLSDVGRQRERNEDSFYVVNSVMHYDLGAEPFSLFVVADGMGGHQKGELASSMAARTAASSLLNDVYLPFLTNDQNANNRPINEALTAAVEQANATVLEAVPDGGTTLTVALLMGNNAYIAHIGDSRAYVFRQDSLKQITQDHSLAQRLEELGQSAEDVKQVQNVLYRAIGQGENIEVDTHMQHIPDGASLLLCSDGLWGLVEDVDITNILRNSSTPQEACQQLIDKANENGGLDNITAIVVSMGIGS